MLEFKNTGLSASGKTKLFDVYSGEIELGKICFFGRWRKYVFYPEPDTLYDHLCLIEISDFCKKQTNIVFKR